MARFDIPTVDPVLRGDYEQVRFEMKQKKANKNDPDVPQSIAGWHFKFGAKYDLSDTTYIVQKDSDTPGDFTIEDAEGGVGYINLAPEDLAAMTYEVTLICDLQGEDVTGKPYTTRFYLPVELDVST